MVSHNSPCGEPVRDEVPHPLWRLGTAPWRQGGLLFFSKIIKHSIKNFSYWCNESDNIIISSAKDIVLSSGGILAQMLEAKSWFYGNIWAELCESIVSPNELHLFEQHVVNVSYRVKNCTKPAPSATQRTMRHCTLIAAVIETIIDSGVIKNLMLRKL